MRALEDMGLPVWARDVSARGPVKNILGCVNVPVVLRRATGPPRRHGGGRGDGVVVVAGSAAK